jgi:competence ComEA-like helix-hairpin-helix protein
LDNSETDAAFAWLESLAVKQGADEALLLKPGERMEAAPEWVLRESQGYSQPLEEGDTGVFPIEEQFTDILDEKLVSLDTGETPNVQLPEMEFGETSTQTPLETSQPELTGPSVPEEAKEASIEAIPELPEWLSSEPGDVPEDMEWIPPSTPVIKNYDINKASLIEFERLPGVGFILAQRIINYRESNGPFTNLEDLLNIPGFSQPTLDMLKGRLIVENNPEAPISITFDHPVVLSEMEEAPESVKHARNTLLDGDVDQAIQEYSEIMKTGEFTTMVIQDLLEATQQHPNDIDLWQTLGEAFLHLNQVQDALKAYIKAEELLQ